MICRIATRAAVAPAVMALAAAAANATWDSSTAWSSYSGKHCG
ncbi:hypothetical protein ACGRHY_26540 [Streptomyces sp. HK10]